MHVGHAMADPDFIPGRSSEARTAYLNAFVDSSPDAIVGVDPHGIVCIWNLAAERLFGYTASEMVGQFASLLVPEADRESFRSTFQKLITGNRVQSYETTRQRKNETQVEVFITAQPVWNERCEVIGVTAIVRDLTVQRRMEQQQRLASGKMAFLAAIVASSPNAIVGSTLTGEITAWNRTAELLFGYTANEILGHSFHVLLPEDEQDKVSSYMEQARAGQLVHIDDVKRRRKDGSTVDVDITLLQVKDDLGTDLGSAAILADITENKRMKAELEEHTRHSAQLVAIVESSPNAIIGLDLEDRITSWNLAAENLFGFAADEVLGQSINILIPAEFREQAEQYLAASLTRVCTYETQRLRKFGSRVDVAITMAPVRNAQGQLMGSAKSVVNITLHKQVQRELDERAQHSAFLSAIVASSPNAIISADLEGRISSWNLAAEILFGYTATEMIGRPISQMAPEGYRDKEKGFLVKVLHEVVHYETKRLHKDGSLIDVAIALAPIRTEQGPSIGIAGVVTDIRERKKAEERLRMIIENSPNAMLVTDAQGLISLANPKLESMFGYASAELMGQHFEMLIPAAFQERHKGRVAAFFADPGEFHNGVNRLMIGRRKDGVEIYLEISLSHFNLGSESFTLAAIADITARREAEQKLEARTRDLVRTNRDLEQFVYAASHDLQEPLRAVAGCMKLLQDQLRDCLDEKALLFMRHSVEGVVRMQQLIDDLLAYSQLNRPDQAELTISLEVALSKALEQVNPSLSIERASIVRDALPLISGNPHHFVLLFRNLIANAIKFHKPNLPSLIHIRNLGCSEQYWTLAVEDNGIGIDPAYNEKIFQIFQRLHTRTAYPGTGVGLAMCRRIVDLHGGRIWVESTPGQGSTFYFTLPLLPSTSTSNHGHGEISAHGEDD